MAKALRRELDNFPALATYPKTTSLQVDANLLHRLLNHASWNTFMRTASEQGIAVTGQLNTACVTCAKTKQRQPDVRHHTDVRAKGPLVRVMIDLQGQKPQRTPRGELCCLAIVDDFSRYS
ncbi:unnamed protein product [Discosporangium mesarthrocarpum]